MRNPPWSRDEHIVALDFYLRHAPKIPGKDSKEVAQLSKLLNSIEGTISGERAESYRNAAGVYMKLMNFRRFDPTYGGVGLANGSKSEEVVWNLYSRKRDELAKLAEQITLLMPSGTMQESLPALDPDEEEADEGQVLSRVHRFRERDRALVRKAKDKFLSTHGRVFCQACGFDFEKTYGSRGADFIECHHTKPVSQLEINGKTKLSDLVLLCSNCHRIVHRRRPWLSIEELILQLKLRQRNFT